MKEGQSLVEVIVAVAVVAALAVALVTTSLVTQKAARGSGNNTQATKLVQENIEQLRVLRDRKGFSAVGTGTYYCIQNTNQDPQNWSLEPVKNNCPSAGVITLSNVGFSRLIVVINGVDASKSKSVRVDVTWTDAGGVQTVSNTTVLSNCVSAQNLC